ncbi:MAG: hypothetical protein IKZ08_02910 [Bacteroidales bacterium]|nr:hypothetical protein [Bacteroidales bacterium]
MAERNHQGSLEREDTVGLTHKAATLAAQTVTDADMALINQFALTELTADQVFTFKAVLCDNKVDRQFERFTIKALQELQALFLGKTVIKDHAHSADNQVARIYKTELQTSATELVGAEPYTQLVAHCYMVRTASNADLIAEIQGGIKKEGSVGFRPSGAICSICGTDNVKSYCRHWPGRSYDKEAGQELCTFTLTGASDAYEFSLVAVPAQRAAGVSKSYTGETVYEEKEPEAPVEDHEKEKALQIRARLLKAKAKTNI